MITSALEKKAYLHFEQTGMYARLKPVRTYQAQQQTMPIFFDHLGATNHGVTLFMIEENT